MSENDYDEFATLLDAVYALHGKNLNAPAKALFFRAMETFPLETIRVAMNAHVRDAQRGQFPPKPADLMAQIEGHAANDGRPGADEAWAIALRSRDEGETVEITLEIMEAFTSARPVLALGDKVGSRKTFIEVYSRLVAEARSAGRAVQWTLSLGWDESRREMPVRAAVAAGRLPASTAATLLPPPQDSGSMGSATATNIARLKAELAKLTPAFERLRHATEAKSGAERERLAEAKKITARKVQQYGLGACARDSPSRQRLLPSIME
ncbi:hypothetical protein [Noviherbaspirillum sp. Root189]|uniref:hypothetical protein n=1 Tax=Noviherbaspirillum sp. Root189 TaxID=1736487 RepID=UPI00070D011A|nr:hypothetical protein [Noviherbaspirillum sp. Root189]KRB85103.1 hypothetical protein ASE07_21295 [Noviherbaspirillum sp. Root189]